MAFMVSGGNTLSVTVVGDIAVNPSTDSVRITVDADTDVTAVNNYYGPPLAVPVDPAGFPHASNLLILRDDTVASTYGNYPNPFRAGTESTTIEFYLGSPATVSLIVYDALGVRTRTLLDAQALPAGVQRVLWDGRNGRGGLVLNGVYFVQLEVNGEKYLHKVAVIK
jgi:hypothetical protein